MYAPFNVSPARAHTHTHTHAHAHTIAVPIYRPGTYSWVNRTSPFGIEALSLVRELRWDAPAGTIVSAPVEEYASLRNATLFAAAETTLAAGTWSGPLALTDAAAGATSEIRVTIPLSRNGDAVALGVAVLSPARSPEGSATIWLNVSASAAAGSGDSGGRAATITLANRHAPPSGSNVVVSSQHFTVRADEHEVELQIFVDRMVIEAFAMGGRAEVVGEEYRPEEGATAVHLYSPGVLALQNLTVFGIGCGWS